VRPDLHAALPPNDIDVPERATDLQKTGDSMPVSHNAN
jgi:hypothetical protein